MAKLVVIGFDGMDPKYIEKWKGEMPSFSKVMEKGSYCPMRSTMPPVTIPAWPAMFSGMNPGNIGFLFFMRLKKDYSMEPYDPMELKDRMVWSIAGRSGKRSGLFIVPGTNPAYPINGFIVPDPFGPSDKCYPEDLGIEAEPYPIESANRIAKKIEYVYKNFERRKGDVKRLLEKGDWDMFIFVPRPTDSIMHFAGEEELRKAYIKADAFLGEVIGLVERNGWNLVIVSDHGAKEVTKRFNVNVLLEEKGLIKFKKSKGRLVLKLADKMAEMGLKPLLYSLSEAAEKVFKKKINPQSKETISVIDWDDTKAFGLFTSTNNSIGIWLHTKKFSKGKLTGDEAEEIRRRVKKELMGFRDPDTGKPVVKRIYDRDELYSGRYIERMPDLVVETEEGYSTEYRPLAKPITKAKRFIHDNYGIFMCYGIDFKKASVPEVSITDVCPTLLQCLGVPVPGDIDGRVISEVFKMEPVIRKTSVSDELSGVSF